MSQELFLLDLSRWDIPADARTRIEKRLHEVLAEEVAKLDMKGDVVVTPLSESKAWLEGLAKLADQNDKIITGGAPMLRRQAR